MPSSAFRGLTRLAAVLICLAFLGAARQPDAHADINSSVTTFVNDPANWDRIQGFVNGSSTYSTTDAAVASGTDGASIEDYFYLVRSSQGVLPTLDEIEPIIADIPLYGTAFAGGVVVGTALDKWLHISSAVASLFDSRTYSPTYLSQCDWKSGYAAPYRWRLLCWASMRDYGWGADNFPDPDCSTQWWGMKCSNPVTGAPNDSGTWNTMSDVARMVDHGSRLGFTDSAGNPRFKVVMSAVDMAATFNVDQPLQPYTNQSKLGNVAIGTPLNVSSDSASADATRSQVLGNTEGAQALVHIIITDDPRPGDPKVPGPGQECTSRTDNPHWSDSGQTVVAKGWLTCNYTGVAYGTMYMWRCDSYASTSTVAFDPACEQVAATIDKPVQVTAGIESPTPIYVPDGATVAQDPGYWIATTTGLGVSPSYSQEGWGYSDAAGWAMLP